MLNVYNALTYNNIHRPEGEQAERIEWADSSPMVDAVVTMGSDRLWRVVEVHTYFNADLDAVNLLLVHPQGEPVPAREEWELIQLRAQAFDVDLSPSKAILDYGWDMIGRSPKVGDRLTGAEPTDHPTRLKEVPLNWVINQVDAYGYNHEAPYPEIRLCWCVAAKELTAA